MKIKKPAATRPRRPIGPDQQQPRRRRSCEESLSLKATRGGRDQPPDARGACAPETTSQGSE